MTSPGTGGSDEAGQVDDGPRRYDGRRVVLWLGLVLGVIAAVFFLAARSMA